MKFRKALLFTLLFTCIISIGMAQRWEVADYLGKKGQASIDLNQPYGMTMDKNGNLWISNNGGHNIVYYDGKKFHAAIGASNQPGYTDGQGVSIKFDSPKGILAVERAGQQVLVVCDAGNNVVRLISISNLSAITTSKMLDIKGFSDPSDVEMDASGNLIVADKQNFCIKKIDAMGQVTVLAGQEGQSGSTDGDALTKAKFTAPTGLYVDGNDIYVADGTAIRKISGGKVSTLGISPDYNWSYNMGGIINATDIVKIGNTWAFSDGCSIRRFDTGESVFKTLAGGLDANNCGYATAKQDTFNKFQHVYQLMYNSTEKALYVADFDNHLIRTVKLGGVFVEAPSLNTTTLYPNPANGKFYIKGLEANRGEVLSVSVINITGRVVYSSRQTILGDQLTIEPEDFNSGLYLVTMTVNNQVVTKKLYVK
ncbi:T9SS type A sorting domain-containing protein [bacterium]|nr:T9SS type A sorting domain-containing protein [bacterium]